MVSPTPRTPPALRRNERTGITGANWTLEIRGDNARLIGTFTHSSAARGSSNDPERNLLNAMGYFGRKPNEFGAMQRDDNRIVCTNTAAISSFIHTFGEKSPISITRIDEATLREHEGALLVERFPARETALAEGRMDTIEAPSPAINDCDVFVTSDTATAVSAARQLIELEAAPREEVAANLLHFLNGEKDGVEFRQPINPQSTTEVEDLVSGNRAGEAINLRENNVAIAERRPIFDAIKNSIVEAIGIAGRGEEGQLLPRNLDSVSLSRGVVGQLTQPTHDVASTRAEQLLAAQIERA